MILVEAAVETLVAAQAAARDGAGRLELCQDLASGGLSPPLELVRAVRAGVDLQLHAMVRPRAGGFHYAPAEVEAMLREIALLRRAGVDGIVVGALTPAGAVDEEATSRLVAAAGPLAVTFHRAVDGIGDLPGAAMRLAELGVTRVLTAGGAATAEAGIAVLARLVEVGIPAIMPGGQIRGGNARRIAIETGADEIHVGFPPTAEPDRITRVVAALADL